MRVFRFWPLALLALAGCQWVPAVPGVHVRKIDIQQGNAITPEMLSKLRLGMTRSQVRFALGTPLLADPFHKDRWDYVYVFEKDEKIVQRRVITVIFADDKLVRLEGDVVAAAAPAEEAGLLPGRAPVKGTAPVTEGPKQE